MRFRLPHLFHKRLTRTQKGLLAVLLCLGVAYGCCLPKTLFHVPYSTVVTDRHGALLGARIAADGQWRFPPRDSVPHKIRECLVCFEDRYFYYHWGVNPLALGRAVWQNVKNRRVVSGGSTLTMQTIRLSRQRPRTLGEKLVEAILATRLEFRASKEEILALYVSHAPFGGNVVGLDAAAWRYFGHPAEALSWAEAATLAVLPNAPAMIHPGKSRQALLDKRNRLLRKLFEQGTLTSSDYELALAEPLPDEPRPLPQTASHLVDLCNQTYNGQRSVTTLDRDLQQQTEALAQRWNNEFRRSDIRDLAIVVADLRTNQLLAYCGNTGYGTRDGSQVDVARAPRSTGSILKPFLYYAMLDEGTLLPGMLLPDIPLNINGFTPQNFSRQFEGAVPAAEALARSLNIPAVVMLQRYGVPKFHQLLQQAGLTTLTRPSGHYGLSLILGGAEATLLEVTNAYARMGRSLLDLPQEPFEWRMENGQANHKQSLKGNAPKSDASFHPGAAWQTLEALTEVNRPEEIDWKALPSMQPIAWKTGTSHGFRDAWAVGISPNYVVGIWVGNATGEGKPGLLGASTAGPVLFDVFNLLPASRSWFARPEGVYVEAEICRQSGHLKGRFCPDTDTVLVVPAGLRTAACPYHHPVLLTADGTRRVYEQCANATATIRKPWFSLPPAWEWYYRRSHPEYVPLPPFAPGCGEDALQPMQFIYPSPGARITLPRQLDGSPGFVTAELAHNNPSATVFWHLDDNYLTQTQDFHQVSLQPTPGKHSLTVVDSEGNSLSTTFYIETPPSAE